MKLSSKVSADVVVLSLEPRSCEACGESPTRLVWNSVHTAVTRTKCWLFRNTIRICEVCGFAYLAPCFRRKELESYYSDSFSRFAGQELDFSPEKRFLFIDSVLAKLKELEVRSVIEIGGNASTLFQDGLRRRYDNVVSYELNAECSTDFSELNEVGTSEFDLLLHYFILEHIADVRVFLRECYRMLRPGGVMVLEVPDLLVYPDDIAALILHEHCNHFTIENLRQLASLEGFELVESTNALCSRTFGFAAAFQRTVENELDCYNARVFERNFAALTRGVAKVEDFRCKLASTMAALCSNPNQKVVFWGANDNLVKMLGENEPPQGVVLVDSDPRKRDFHPKLSARLPEDAVDALLDAEALILFTRLHAESILRWIEKNIGRRFEQVVIADY